MPEETQYSRTEDSKEDEQANLEKFVAYDVWPSEIGEHIAEQEKQRQEEIKQKQKKYSLK